MGRERRVGRVRRVALELSFTSKDCGNERDEHGGLLIAGRAGRGMARRVDEHDMWSVRC